MKQDVTLAILGCALTYLAGLPTVATECCISDEYTGFCQDGKLPEAYYCGARGDGACNIFGCNCQGGCIKITFEDVKRSTDEFGNATAKTSSEDSFESPAYDIFRAADVDLNGWLDAEEVGFYFRRQGLEVDDQAWIAMDVDKDGRLSPEEIDCDME